MTQEFHISVTPVGNDEYLVRTEQVAPGVPLAEEQLTWRVEDWLTQARQLMSDPLQGLLQSDRAPSGLPAELSGLPAKIEVGGASLSLVNLGQQLYSALFQGTLRDSWVTAQGIAQNRRETLRLRLGLKGPRLPRLPWEVMYGNDIPAEKLQQGDSQSARPLAAGTHLIFSRYQPSQRLVGSRPPLMLEANEPLRILMIIAAPSDQDRLQLHQEARKLQQELRRSAAPSPEGATPPDIQLTILDQPGREQLTQTLEQGQYQVLHYAGHSDLSSAGGSLYLVNHRTGLTEVLSGDDLAGLLVNNGIRLAVFNSCRGTYTAAADPVNERERNLAEALVSRGIPAVLAMAEQIPDNVALTLTWLFYRNLKQGYPIDLSLSRARQGLISAYGSNQLYWALPILYLNHEFDGYLTPVDRTFDNPADRLLLTPQAISSFSVMTSDEKPLLPASFLTDDSQPVTDEEMVASAVLAETDPGDWMQPLEAFNHANELETLEVFSDLELEALEAFNDADEPETLEWIRQLTAEATQENTQENLQQTVAGAASTTHQADGLAAFDPSDDELSEDLEPLSPDSGFSFVPLSAFTPPRSLPGAITLHSDSQASLNSADVAPTIVQDFHEHPTPRAGRVVVLPLLGALGAVAIAFLGYALTPTLLDFAKINQTELSTPTDTGESFSQKLASSSTEQVKTIALTSFNKKQLAQGQQAVEVLLSRNALSEATNALEAISESHQDKPEIQFLQGRLAWQSIKQGELKYTLTDVRQAWEKAAEEEPNSAVYQQALAFAYYAEGEPLKARQTWMQTLSTLKDAQSTGLEVSNSAQTASTQFSKPALSPEKLMAYAGVALSLQRISANQPPDKRELIAGKAAKIYQMVMASAPERFSTEALSQDWLWSAAAIQDWEKLAQMP